MTIENPNSKSIQDHFKIKALVSNKEDLSQTETFVKKGPDHGNMKALVLKQTRPLSNENFSQIKDHTDPK